MTILEQVWKYIKNGNENTFWKSRKLYLSFFGKVIRFCFSQSMPPKPIVFSMFNKFEKILRGIDLARKALSNASAEKVTSFVL